jgi:hypothetical protein
MKRFALLCALLVLAGAARADDARTFTPFFDFAVSEAVFVPAGENTFFSGGNMKTDVGLLTALDKVPLIDDLPGKSSLFTLYSFGYDGPGFQPQDQQEGFQYQDMSHNLTAEYRWKFLGPWRLRPGFGYTKSYVLLAADETWGQGLYDSNAIGGQLALDYMMPHGMLTAQVLYRQITYPNYTDLLRIFESAGLSANTGGGLQDNNMLEYSLSGTYKKAFADFRYIGQDYLHQTVVDIMGPDAGTYGSTPQTSHTVAGDIGFSGKLWRFEIKPKVTVTQYVNNQNFLDFQFVGDPAPNAYKDWYSYMEYRADLPLFLNLTEGGTAIFGDASLVATQYTDRVARNSEDENIGHLEHDLMLTFTGGMRFRLNEITFMKISAGIIEASSNNTYEVYLPYNYTGYTGGISFEMAY